MKKISYDVVQEGKKVIKSFEHIFFLIFKNFECSKTLYNWVTF